MKQKSNKLAKAERNRYSIYTDDFNHCYYCRKYVTTDKHEVYGGANRLRSIKNGLVVPLCRTCHSNDEIISILKVECQKIYELNHTREEFIKLIGRNYIDE
jgi:hypothetical protein